MAEYSSKSDVKDPLLQGISQESDHLEAEAEINKELKRRGIDPESSTQLPDAEVLRDLSVAFACRVRCKYALKTRGDAFSLKLPEYKEDWRVALARLDEELVAGAVSTGGTVLEALPLER
jgi:hypothetical protein